MAVRQQCISDNMNSEAVVDIVIPALNEEESIGLVLRDLPEVRTVFVVDNGSTDGTAKVATDLGAVVIEEPQRGYGKACLRGLQEIADRIQDGGAAPDIVAFADADFSDHPQFVGNLVEEIVERDYDFALGSRLLGEREAGAMPPQSIFGNKLACFLMRVLFGSKYTDLGPLRAIRYPALTHIQMCDENFGWTIEMQIKATKAELRTIEIPVPYRKRIGVSKISGTLTGTIRAGTKILYIIAKYGVKSWDLGRLSANDSSSASGNLHSSSKPEKIQ